MDGSNPLDHFGLLHSRQDVLSDRLEALADSLPSANPLDCRDLGTNLGRILDPLHGFEERHFFPLVEARLPARSLLHGSVARLRAEHREDRDAAADLELDLLRLAHGCRRDEIDAIAYQIRSLFVGLRRHEAFERDVLFPVARATLTPHDLRRLESALLSKRTVT